MVGLSVVLWLTGCVPVLESPGDDTAATGDGPACGDEGPQSDWPQNTPPDTLTASGFTAGDVPPDFCMPDQNWETTSLWQFYGDVVVLDISTSWCGPCQQLATGVQETADSYADDGLTYITLLAQDVNHETPDEADLDDWADYFGIVEPVVADVEGYYETPIPTDAFPGVWVIGRDMRVVEVVTTYTDEAVRQAIEGAL